MAVDLWVMERVGLSYLHTELAQVSPLETQQPRREAHLLELAANEVVVSAPDGSVIQRIPFDPNELTEFNRDFFMTTPDINFDSWPDLLLIASQGLQNVYYDGWIWDPEQGQYVYAPEIRLLSSPFFDEKTGLIKTFIHGSASDNESAVWEWQDGQLKEIRRRTQIYDEETGLFTIRTYGLDSEGNLSLMSTQTLTEEQLSALQ